MKSKNKIKDLWKRFWFLLWKDDSFKGWIFSIIVIFIFIKFIFFPGLSLVTGTALPLAIVESCSMYHEGNLFSNYDEWWLDNEGKYSNFEISNEEFEKFKMKNGFNKGDILFIIGTKPENIEIGDNNNGQLSFEKSISPDKIIGKAAFKILPYFGWVKLVFFEMQKSSSDKGFCNQN